MTDEERNALLNFKFFMNYKDFTDFYYDDAEIIYKLIEKQQKENIVLRQGLEENTRDIKNKNAIINAMAKELTTPLHSKEWTIDYYTKLVKEKNK